LFLFVYILLFFVCSNAPVKPSKVYFVSKAFYVNDAHLQMFLGGGYNFCARLG